MLGIHVDVFLVTEVKLAVRLGPTGSGVFLPVLLLITVLGSLACLNAAVFLAAVAFKAARL